MSNAIGKIFAGVCLAVAISLMAAPASAQNVSLSLTIKSKAFQPSTLKAPS